MSLIDRFADVFRKKEPNPYLRDYRLQDVLAALQFFGGYPDYDLTPEEFRTRIALHPKSADDWDRLFSEHPEFFRQSEHASDYSLILRRAKPRLAGEKPKLDSAELSMLIETAIHLQAHALEMRRERRWILPLLLNGIGIVALLVGTIVGAMIKGQG